MGLGTLRYKALWLGVRSGTSLVGPVEEILDGQIRDAYDSRAHFETVNRMVKTAMWCLQDRPELRPTIGKVAKMLEGTVEITNLNKPTIFFLGEEETNDKKLMCCHVMK
ncbi:hypothetical protein AAZX31_02G081900 [Glycine max]|nr:hypothetical protein GYH30_003432 [Glycine max]